MYRRAGPCAVLAIAIGLALQGCGSDNTASPGQQNQVSSIESTAGTWRTYVLPSPSAVRPGPPPADGTDAQVAELTRSAQLALQRDDAMKAEIDYWDGGTVRRWNEYERHLIQVTGTNPPRAARGLALTSVAMYDAVIAAWDSKFHYVRNHPYQYGGGPSIYGVRDEGFSYVSDRAASSRAAADVLTYLYPGKADSIAMMLRSALDSDLYSGNHFQSDVDAGEQVGAAVASMILDRAMNDNSDATAGDVPPSGPGYWVPTPPGYVGHPMEPAAGMWKTWILPNGGAVLPPDPPKFGEDEFNLEMREVYDVSRSLSAERRDIALFWSDGGGTVTPPGHWNQIGVDLAVAEGLNEPRTARMLAILGMAQADAFIACWDCKYHYWCIRPVTVIRAEVDSTWLPIIVTPPFPSYPSGHSSTSGAASTFLAYIFPDHAIELRAMGVEAMQSRLYGGIHFTSDNLTGFNMGSEIGLRAIEVAATDGCPMDIPHAGKAAAAGILGPARTKAPPPGARLEDSAD